MLQEKKGRRPRPIMDQVEDVLLVGTENAIRGGRAAKMNGQGREFRRTMARCLGVMAGREADPERLGRIRTALAELERLGAADERRNPSRVIQEQEIPRNAPG
jgi:hypothetical protein